MDSRKGAAFDVIEETAPIGITPVSPAHSPAMSKIMPSSVTLLAAVMVSLAALGAQPSDEEISLRGGGKDADLIIAKARDVLSNAQVYAVGGIGVAGSPSVGCWALTVVVRYDRSAKDFLNRMLECAEPEGRLYAVAGLLLVEPKQRARFQTAKFVERSEDRVWTQFGCSSLSSRFETEVNRLLEGGAKHLLFETLPSIYETVDVRRPPSAKKE